MNKHKIDTGWNRKTDQKGAGIFISAHPHIEKVAPARIELASKV